MIEKWMEETTNPMMFMQSAFSEAATCRVPNTLRSNHACLMTLIMPPPMYSNCLKKKKILTQQHHTTTNKNQLFKNQSLLHVVHVHTRSTRSEDLPQTTVQPMVTRPRPSTAAPFSPSPLSSGGQSMVQM